MVLRSPSRPAVVVPVKPRPARSAHCASETRAGVRREVVAEDELADPGALGDAPDLGDVGVQPGHPLERLTGDGPLAAIQKWNRD
jgi:hypothetical protein